MDDLLDLSPIEQELEALAAIYLDELKVHRSENGQKVEEVELLLHPATGNDTTKQFVRMNLVFQPSSQYPDEAPEMVIRNPRGLGEEEMASLVEDMRKKAEESVGEVMLYTLIEMAKEALTEGNIPHSPCVVCLEHFQEHDQFHRTACYHYFHTLCLHRYLEHSRGQMEQKREEAEIQRHLNPEEETQEVLIVCPVCRTTMDDDSLAVFCSDTQEEALENFDIPPNIREQQKKMAELYEKQKLKGAIIDVEWERNKFLVNPDERMPVAVTAKMDDASSEGLAKDNDATEDSRNENRYKSNISDKHQGKAVRKWDSSYDHDNPKQHHRNRNETYDRRHQDSHYNARKNYYSDGAGRNNRGVGARQREDTYRRMDNKGFVDCSASEGSGSVTFVKDKHMGNREGGFKAREGGFGTTRGRGSRSEVGKREPHWKQGRGSEGYSEARDDDDDSRFRSGNIRSGRGDRRNQDSPSYQDGQDENCGRNSSSAFNNGKDDSFEDNWPDRRGRGGNFVRGQQRRGTGGSSRGRGGFGRRDEREDEGVSWRGDDEGAMDTGRRSGRGRGGFGRKDFERRDKRDDDSVSWKSEEDYGNSRGRGRGGFRRGDERDVAGKSWKNDDDSSSFKSSRSGNSDHKRDFTSSGFDNRSDKKRFDDDNQDEQRHSQHDHHGSYSQHRNPRGGRRNEFNRGDRDERRGQGYGDNGRGGGGNRSDQRGGRGREAGGHGRPGNEAEDEDEGHRRATDLKNLEINQRWRELNYGHRGGEKSRDAPEGKTRVCGVIDDDENAVIHDGNNNHDEDYGDGDDDDIRGNPNYEAGNVYVASSDSEEDWGKEADPYTFERRCIRRDQFDEYSKYKKEQLSYYAQKVEKRAEKQNSTRAEQRRIQREQQLKQQREQRNRLEQREEQAASTTESLSVLDRFRQSQEKQQFEDDNESHPPDKNSKASEKSGQNVREVKKGNLRQDKRGDAESAGGDGLSKDGEYYRKKAEPLPRRNKEEGIKWVGVRDNDDAGDSSYADGAAASDVHGNSVFEDSWKRREEKEKQRRKRQGTKARKNDDGAEKREDNSKTNKSSEDSLVSETRVRSRRRDREKEALGLHKNFDTNMENDICYTQGDIVNKQSNVSCNGIAQVSSKEGDSNDCDLNSNLQRNTKTAKPLDLRKVSNRSGHNDIDNIVEELPNLLQDICVESTKEESSKKPQKKTSAEDSRKLRVAQKNVDSRGGRNDITRSSPVVENETLPSELDNTAIVPNSKCKNKPKPLDFRKGGKKGS